MTDSPANLDRLTRREERAHECLNVAINSWIGFVDELNAIHAEGDWKSKAPSWKAYLEAEFLPKLDYGYDRLYQLQAAQPFATAIERQTGILLNERQTRLIKSLGYEASNPIAAELVVRAQATADYLQQSLAPKHIQASHTVLSEASYLGKISIEGESFGSERPQDLVQIAITQEAIEANARGRQKIIEGSKKRALTFTPELMLVDNKQYAVFPGHIPIETVLGKQITVYVDAA